MRDLLRALDWKVSVGAGLRLIGMIAAATLIVLGGGMAAANALQVPLAAVQIAIWGIWLIWLGILFPHNYRRDTERPCAFPYRRAFVREILLGVAIAFSQLLRPAFDSGVADDLVTHKWELAVAIGAFLIIVGVALIGMGVSALGVARTLFVYEYVPSGVRVTTTGIYRILRHPLFLGGVVVSLGLAVLTGSQMAVELALVNACVMPIYVQLEDRRCCVTLGSEYMDYRTTVGALGPRRRSAMSRSASANQASGSTEPTVPRSLVKRP